MNSLRHYLLSDWFAKILAMTVALVIWIGVSAATQQVGLFPGGIPVTLENIPDGLVALQTDQSVDVTVVAERTLWQTMTQENFYASIDLADAKAGAHDATVRATSRIAGARIVGIKPKQLLVRLEPLGQKSVPVRVSYDGQVADGFAAGEATITPAIVIATGPQSQLDQLDAVGVRVKLSGEQAALTVSAPVSLPDEQGVTRNTQVSPRAVSVSVPIERAGRTKAVGVVVQTEGSPPAGYIVAMSTVNPATVVVTGSAAALSSLSTLQTKPIRLSEVRESSSITSELELPDGIRLVDPSSTSVSVTLSVQPTPPTSP